MRRLAARLCSTAAETAYAAPSAADAGMAGNGLADAQGLKRHCSDTIAALGSATPPEAFLFRGNAYMALGQPYFAKADYNIAGEIIALSGRHHVEADAALEKLTGTTVCSSFPGSSKAIGMLVEPMLGKQVAIREFEGTGRGVVAIAPMEPGDVVVKRNKHFARYPLQNRRCSNCTKPLPTRFLSCANPTCHEEYCSRECRSEAWHTYHAGVCRNEEFQSIELTLFAALQRAPTRSDFNDTAMRLLAHRLMALSVSQRRIPMSFPELRVLSGALVFNPNELASDDVAGVFERTVRVTGTRTALSFEEYVGILARLSANCFQTEGSIHLNIARSMLNHSNNANVAESPEEELVATRRVQVGEQLTINYFPQLKHLDAKEREEETRRRGLFFYKEL